jgi:hypothetical protein
VVEPVAEPGAVGDVVPAVADGLVEELAEGVSGGSAEVVPSWQPVRASMPTHATHAAVATRTP